MGYTEEEAKVLSYFFTNLDKPVFFAKNFHPEVWALMQARYSRASQGMRESFLLLLKEDADNYESLVKFLTENAGGIEVDNASKKAISFMEKWVLGFGHSSVAEGAVVGIGMEGVSILETKVIEDNRISSFVEKSTRYVSFGRDSFYIDPALKNSNYGTRVQEVVDNLFQAYTDLHEPVLDYVKEQAPREENQSESAWNRSCAARRFDAIRYLLPACTKTSLGWTVNARALEHAINKMLSHPLGEMQALGKALQDEGTAVLPSLLKYTGKKDYLADTESDMRDYASSLSLDSHPGQIQKATLVDAPADLDTQLLTAIVYRYSNAPYEEVKSRMSSLSPEEKEKIYDRYLQKMGEFDWPMRELEHSKLTWDIVIDYGAFRDLQRHRVCTQTNQLLTTFYGYSTPPDIVGAGVQKEYDDAMGAADELFRELHAEMPYHAQYVVPLGYRHRYLMSANLREMYHIIKLRSTAHGHFSYREFARLCYDELKGKYPLAMKHAVCNMDDEELGRLRSELRFEEKLKRGSV